MTDETSALEQSVNRLAALARAGHPIATAVKKERTFITALNAGRPIPEALTAAGVANDVVAAIGESSPSDLPTALEGIADALGDVSERRSAFRRLALYPLLLALVALILAAVSGLALAPSIAWVSLPVRVSAAPATALSIAATVALGIGLVSLVLLSISLASRAPVFPARVGREASELAFLLRVAEVLARASSELPAAFVGASRLVAGASLRAAAEELASGLRRGETPLGPGSVLFGEVGAGLFAAATRAGAGTETLAALAAARESNARANLPAYLLRAEATTLAVGGLAIGAAAVSFMLTYAGTLGGL